MADLSTTYMGLELENPLIASSSPLSKDLGTIREMEDAGAAAVVLHSLFEEQVTIEEETLNENLVQGTDTFAEALSYFPDFKEFKFAPDAYVEHIRKAKETVTIPLIGSLNGVSKGGWIRYAKEIEQAGADGLELNIYFLPTDPMIPAEHIERYYVQLVKAVKESIGIPLAVKLSSAFSSIPNMAKRLAGAGADALVLFNRFYQPDIDPEKLEVRPVVRYSSSDELVLRLRWIGILYGRIEADLAVTGGLHTAADAVKGLMAGATAVQTTSAILKHGAAYFGELVSGLSQWLETHGHDSVGKIRGLMSQEKVAEPAAYERANYLKIVGS